ncbi:hypothetical protein [Rikenella microfusus]|uniref:Uncharacterized protein n=1 Tax=Rikenella microfusus TaxID=28139 RepID=A0A379MSS7_9BACT|nr:hypothetical protein [Rikenella microfusus]SUE34583.1 Uncharacterised protein [Rikenella microfusus]
MLQIYTDNRLIDFSDDISVDLVFENPLLTTDRIPATYSLSYDLPLTPRNREIFGNPDRAATGNDRFSIEYDDAILEREVFHDLRLENGYTISREEGQKYVLRYSSASDGEQADAEIREAVSVVDGLRVMDSSTYVMAFRSRCPPQALQADSESVLHLTVVKAYRAEEAEDDDDDEASTYDMTIQARPVQCNVRQWWLNDDKLAESTTIERFYIPEIDRIESKRPDTILLGLYQGVQNASAIMAIQGTILIWFLRITMPTGKSWASCHWTSIRCLDWRNCTPDSGSGSSGTSWW